MSDTQSRMTSSVSRLTTPPAGRGHRLRADPLAVAAVRKLLRGDRRRATWGRSGCERARRKWHGTAYHQLGLNGSAQTGRIVLI